MELFIAPEWLALLEYNGLTLFDAIWKLEASWVEPPNYRRGGWSGVCRMELVAPAGIAVLAYLKRQQNHSRFSLMHPFKGEATFAREFHIIRHLRQCNVPTLNPVYFGEHFAWGARRAILMTEALVGYRSLQAMLDDGEVDAMPFSQKRRLLSALARAVRKMHEAGVEHRSLYAKHLMVKQAGDFEIAVIDLEKSRLSYFPYLRMIKDLTTLNHRSGNWSLSSRLYFYREYLGEDAPGRWTRWLGRWIYRKSLRKQLKYTQAESRTIPG